MTAIDELARTFATGTEAAISSAAAAASPTDRRAALRAYLTPVLADRTPLRRHLELFDTDGSGTLTWQETFRGFVDVGVSPQTARVISTLSHVVMGFPSSGSPLDWRINLSNLEHALHAVNTQLYSERVSDAERERRLQEIVARFGRPDGRLGRAEFGQMIDDHNRRDRRRFTFYRRRIGRQASRLEFGVLVDLAGVGQGAARAVSIDDLRDLYDGILMYALLPPRKLAIALLRLR